VKSRYLAIFLVGVGLGIVLGWWLCRQADIDSCLDRGGRWLYEKRTCEGESLR